MKTGKNLVHKGFTLIEIIIVFFIIGVASTLLLISPKGNESLEGNALKDIIRTDLLQSKKSMLLLSENNTITFRKDEPGYQIQEDGTTDYHLSLGSMIIEQTNGELQNVLGTLTAQHNNTNFLIEPPFTFVFENDDHFQETLALSNQASLGRFIVEQERLTSVMKFFFQDSTNTQNISNRVIYILFSSKNKDTNPTNDIVISQIYSQGNEDFDSLFLSFSEEGKAQIMAEKDGIQTNMDAISLDLIHRDEPDTVLTTLHIPDDL